MVLRFASGCLVATLLALPAVAGAQEPTAPPPAYSEQIEVQETLLDVLVTDAAGNVILGLAPGDFDLRENGKPVAVTGATFYSNRRFLAAAGASAGSGAAGEEIPEDRYFVFLLQDQLRNANEAPELVHRQLDALRQARRWVQEEMLPGDWAAIAVYDSKLKLYADFSHDRQALLAAFDAASHGQDPGLEWPSRQAAGDEPSLRARLPKGDALRDGTTRLEDALGVLAEAAGPIAGRKNLILFSAGFGDVNSWGQYRPDPRFYPPMLRSLNANNVAVYPVELYPPQVDHPLADSLNQLAGETGGRYLYNFTSFFSPLQQISQENNGYYLLSFHSAAGSADEAYRRVTVKARNPEFRVRTRQGFRVSG